jgi:NAD(P)-dependent dehydrogenase (short-subunit alcohol dehydrogenase family)
MHVGSAFETNSGKRLFIVTGGTGVLGTELCKQIASFDGESKLCIGFRKTALLDRTMGMLDSSSTRSSIVSPFHCEFCDDGKTTNVIKFEHMVGSGGNTHDDNWNEIVLINNAGTCLPGSTHEALKRSLNVNAIAPLTLSQRLIACVDKMGMHNTAVTILNVSSGDGELALLHTDLSARVKELSTIEELTKFAISERETYRGLDYEYAYGSTPMYSFSKALLNAATRVQHSAFAGRVNNNYHIDTRRRAIAVCPGNFKSPMTTSADEDEESSGGLQATDYAARGVLSLLSTDKSTDGGRFYRHGEVIPF